MSPSEQVRVNATANASAVSLQQTSSSSLTTGASGGQVRFPPRPGTVEEPRAQTHQHGRPESSRFVHEARAGANRKPCPATGRAEEASGAVAATTDSATEAVSGQVAGDDRVSVTSGVKASSVRTSLSRNFRGRVGCRAGGVAPGCVPGSCGQCRSRSAGFDPPGEAERACRVGASAVGCAVVRGWCACRSSGASGVAFFPIHCNEQRFVCCVKMGPLQRFLGSHLQ